MVPQEDDPQAPVESVSLNGGSLSSLRLPEGGKPRGGTLSGDIRSHKVHSNSLDENRKVLVYLPEGYEKSPAKSYPVVYVQDGQSIFDDRTATRDTEWGLDETAQKLIGEGKMAETIIVAVANGGSGPSRVTDFTDAVDPVHGQGQARNYLSFLKDELKPMVDATYRTLTGAETTAVMGSSLGGYFALYAGLSAPSTFGLVGALSPSLWFGGQDMLKRIAEMSSDGPRPSKIWIDMGTKEDNPAWSTHQVRDLEQAKDGFVDHGYIVGQNLFAPVIEGGEHTNLAWRNRSGDVLRTLLPPAD